MCVIKIANLSRATSLDYKFQERFLFGGSDTPDVNWETVKQQTAQAHVWHNQVRGTTTRPVVHNLQHAYHRMQVKWRSIPLQYKLPNDTYNAVSYGL
jgi:hypothetical protein